MTRRRILTGDPVADEVIARQQRLTRWYAAAALALGLALLIVGVGVATARDRPLLGGLIASTGVVVLVLVALTATARARRRAVGPPPQRGGNQR